MALWHWPWTEKLTVTNFAKWMSGSIKDWDTSEDVSSNGALKLSVWWSSVRLITETIATLPNGIFQKTGEDRKELPGYFLHTLLHDQPNDEQTPVDFWEGRVGPLCVHGNSFAEKKFLGDRIVALQGMPFDNVALMRRPKDNKIFYTFTDRGKTEEMPFNKVFHIKGFAPDDNDLGLSPVEYGARSLGGALSAERASSRVYSRGLRAQGFFTPPIGTAAMDKGQRKDFIKNYVNPGEGSKGEGKTLIFPPGMEWKAMNITPRDAEMLLTRGFNVEDVCRWMRVPPILVGHSGAGQTMFGSGVEQVILGWLVLGLRSTLRQIEAAVNFHLIPLADRMNGIYFEFNFEGLLRADSAARASLMSTLAQNGLRTRNELRRIDHYPGMDGADDLTVQSNLIPLDKLGEAPPDQTPSAIPPDQIETIAASVRESIKSWLINEGKIR